MGLCVRWGVCIRLYAVEIKGQVTSIFSQSDYCVIKNVRSLQLTVSEAYYRDNHDNNNIPTTTNNNIKIIEFVSCYCDMVLNISQ